ncbi:hypothetical protein ACWGLF_02660 [Streptomyces puniciscabiei]
MDFDPYRDGPGRRNALESRARRPLPPRLECLSAERVGTAVLARQGRAVR